MPFLMFPLIAALSAGLAFGGGTEAEASAEAKFPPIIQKIIDKFNLDEDKVAEVIVENRAEAQARAEVKQQEKLDKLVEKGELTAEQEAAINAKIAELKAWAEANKDEWAQMSSEERKEVLKQKREEIESWAEQQGIDLAVLGRFGLWGQLNGIGFGLWGHHKFELKSDDDSSRGFRGFWDRGRGGDKAEDN